MSEAIELRKLRNVIEARKLLSRWERSGQPFAVVSPGGRRHLFMRPWHDAFVEAEILLGPVRARTTNSWRGPGGR